MYIESIELDNFKSFGDKVLIPFFPGFTTISGPNGSGKSNIIDSVLFALGLSTNKTMRAEKLTDLMNNLSGKTETQVSINFFNEKDNTSFKISRKIRLKKNGQYESNYYFNDKVKTLSFIHDTLALSNVSPNAYNVVMQGDVTQIISMSALERRRIIDELSGIAHFDKKIEASRDEINQALEKLERQSILLSEFSDRLEQLKSERDQALKYTSLRDYRNKLELLLRQVRINELEIKINELDLLIGQKAQTKQELHHNIINIDQKIYHNQSIIEETNKILEKLDINKRQELQKAIDSLKENIHKLQSSQEYQDKQLNDYQKQINISEKNINHAQEQIKNIQKNINNIIEEGKANEQLLIQENNIYQDIQMQIKIKSSNLSTNKVLELQDKYNKSQIIQSELQAQKTIAQDKINSSSNTIQELKNKLNNLINNIQELENNNINSQNKELDEKHNAIQRYIQRLKNEKLQTEQEIKDITNNLYNLDKQLSKLEMKKQVSEESNINRTADLILKSGISGIHGVLAQLAAVKPEYMLALEISGGARLKSIVVDNDQIAQKLIEYLRAKNLGRATFLPLNKFKYMPSLPSINKNNGIIDWAVNLINCDDLYMPVFQYAFGNTLIMHNINQARRLLGEYRIVTLEGDLLDKSGAMTGGSQQKNNSNLFGNKDALLIQDITQQIQQFEYNLSQANQSLKDINHEIKESEKEYNNINQALLKSHASHGAHQAEYKKAKLDFEEYQVKLRQLSQEKDNQEKNLTDINYKLEHINRELNIINNQLVQESSQIKDSGLGDLINKSQELEYNKKQLELLLQNLNFNKNNAEKDILMAQNNIKQALLDMDNYKQAIQDLEYKQKTQLADINNYQDELIIKENNLKQIQAEIFGLQKQKDINNKELLNYTHQKAQASENLKHIAQEITDYKFKLADMQGRLKELNNHDDNLQAQIEIILAEEKQKRKTDHINQDELKKDLDKIELQMQKLEPINMKAIDEYNHVFEKLNDIKEKCENIQNEKLIIEERISDYNQHKYNAFMQAYNSVNQHFQEIFSELSFGSGELILENNNNPFEGGLIIQARPRNKKMQRLESMSGGEKSLTALSFLFALQWHNPAPFYAFDEVDMFLDGLNVERLSKMINKQSQLAQFIVVSLRKPMLEKSQRAIGVCQGRNSFSSVSGIKVAEQII